jgi:hypothetical protein
MYDIIGDIHGYADHLELLLDKLGYTKVHGVYSHPTRKAIFLGDLIDRGPKVKETVQIVKAMVESGNAKCIMANHEFNYICYYTEGKNGPLRPHIKDNKDQNQATRDSFSKEENLEVIEWFKTLPMWIEEENFRCVHACWQKEAINTLKHYQGGPLIDMQVLKEQFYKGTDYHNAIETALKGIEIKLPGDVSFTDKGGVTREDARLTWWDLEQITPETSVKEHITKEMIQAVYTKDYEKLTFFGHYWQHGPPKVTNPKAQCLDFSIAAEKMKAEKRYLCAYRFDGEDEIDASKFVSVKFSDF